MAHSQKGKTPALIVHGAADTRVPPTQSQELFRALRHAGVDTKLVIYPREPHGLRENVHQLDFVRRFVDWFERHLQG
jgi:dipeptidyl aminopeptidase/acylaminoacyl peptidase